MQLDPAAAAAGFRLSAHDTLPSTNTEALALARRGETGPLWVTARQQTAGRGRRGNAWISTPGNLYATLLVCDPAAPENAPQLSFVAALAVFDAIVDRAAPLREKLALKWPNDILCGRQKLAGILIESENVEARLAVAIGIGVNCMHHPVETAYPATDLATAGAAVAAEDLFGALSGAMARRLDAVASRRGFPVHSRRLARSCRGHRRRDAGAATKNREFVGRAEALDERGRLLLRLADGTLQTITAGDVFPVAASERN